MKKASSQDYCRTVLERSGSSFGTAIAFLPSQKRRAMTAFYAFCRAVDDAVDDAPNPREARRNLVVWDYRLDAAFEGRPLEPIGEEIAWVHRTFGLRKEHLALIIDGCRWDLFRSRYETFADLYAYCYRVASAVGLAVVTITSGSSPVLLRYAELTGVAVQLTNIIRDIGEDARNGRIYLPREDRDMFGVSEEDILRGNATPEFRRLIAFEAHRAHEFYRLAEAAAPREARRNLVFAETIRETYHALLRELERNRYPVFTERVSLPKRRKIAIAAKHLLFAALS